MAGGTYTLVNVNKPLAGLFTFTKEILFFVQYKSLNSIRFHKNY